jgi:probable rRNA maturation factor
VKVSIFNKQRSIKISKADIEKIVFLILEKEKVTTDEVIINFVGEKTIKELHNKFFNDPSSTDCISFPMDQKKTKGSYCILGEIFVCSIVAKKISKHHNHSPHLEMYLYVIHGILHLIGYKDKLSSDIEMMRKKEKKYLSLIQKII